MHPGGVPPTDAAPTSASPAPDALAPDASTVVDVPPGVDVRRSLVRLRRGGGDPTWRGTGPEIWHATRRGGQPATLRLRLGTAHVRADAWGPAAADVLVDVPGMLGLLDDPTGFAAHLHPVVDRAHRAHGGLRVARGGDVWSSTVTAVLEQRVVGLDATASWRRLVTRHGAPAPGPAPGGLRVAPPPAAWRTLPVWEWRQAGVDAQRADAVRRAAEVAHALTPDLPPAELARRLCTVRGIGPWTAAEVTSRALGDPDAVQVGDAHLSHLVGWALTGRRVDDAGMLHLLAPWRGHRQRVLLLLQHAHGGRPPAYGPRGRRALPMR